MESQDLDDIPFELTETDRQNLAQGDEKFQPHTWEELKSIIGIVTISVPSRASAKIEAARNDLAILKRKPSDLLRYIRWTRETINTYGSITNFVLSERLHWQPLTSSTAETGPLFDTESDVPFESGNDFLILRNDWPYGISPEIIHLVVWLKPRIAVVGEEGHLTAASRKLIDAFVKKTFIREDRGFSSSDVMWFKNWVGLQSVRGVEHMHVLLRNIPRPLLDEWTGPKGHD